MVNTCNVNNLKLMISCSLVKAFITYTCVPIQPHYASFVHFTCTCNGISIQPLRRYIQVYSPHALKKIGRRTAEGGLKLHVHVYLLLLCCSNPRYYMLLSQALWWHALFSFVHITAYGEHLYLSMLPRLRTAAIDNINTDFSVMTYCC